jgi:hypothetical protein
MTRIGKCLKGLFCCYYVRFLGDDLFYRLLSDGLINLQKLDIAQES